MNSWVWKVFPDRPMPDVFWYQREFLYTLAYQQQEAPLIFVIAGTGSSFYSSSMVFLQEDLLSGRFSRHSVSPRRPK